jgi:tetratricopeptide (TPR) repeat protein
MYNNMGDNYRQQNDFENAYECYEKSLEMRRKISKDQASDLEIAKTLMSLGKLSNDKNQFDQSVLLLTEAMEIIAVNHGRKHPVYAQIVQDIALTYFKQKKYGEAEKLFKESLDILLEKNDAPQKILNTRQNLAVCLDCQKKYEEAEPLFKESISELKTQYYDQNKDKALRQKIVAILGSLVGNLGNQKKFQDAEGFYKELQQLTLETNGEESIEFANVSRNLAACLLFLEKHDESLVEFSKALVVYEKNLGDDHDTTLDVRNNLEDLRNYIYQRDKSDCCKCNLQ